MQNEISGLIEAAWEDRLAIGLGTTGPVRDAVEAVLTALDGGKVRVAVKTAAGWTVNQWVKKAILLSFRLSDNREIAGGPGAGLWWDKVPSKFEGWTEESFRAAGIRAVPGVFVRRGAFFAKGVILMPSFVNVGAYVDEGTMIDSCTTIGSAAQIGKNCHISANVCIGGVLEPVQAGPVIVEDGCFVGAGSTVTEGVLVEQGSVIAMGVHLGASTPIVDRQSGEISYGRVTAGSVVVPGVHEKKGGIGLACAVVVKRVDAQTRAKTSINELLRPAD